MLSESDRAIYEWQLDVPGMGEGGQETLRNTTALVSRIGGLGGPLAFELAAAGFGRLILAHGGALQPSDLNRQILMRHEDLGRSRVESARKTLNAFNPNIEVEIVPENFSEANAEALVANIGALEGIKLLTGVGTCNAGKMIFVDTARMSLQTIGLSRRADCEICGASASAP